MAGEMLGATRAENLRDSSNLSSPFLASVSPAALIQIIWTDFIAAGTSGMGFHFMLRRFARQNHPPQTAHARLSLACEDRTA